MNIYSNLRRPAKEELRAVERGKDIPELLYDLLVQPTPHGNEHLLYKYMPKGCRKDAKGNVIVNIGEVRKHKTMFSCHLDTVQKNTDKIDLVITDSGITEDSGYIYAIDKAGNPSILGADDKLGIYAMLTMIEHEVPGMYVFHVGEEVGGVGSIHLSTKYPGLFKRVERCIAFDRKGYTSVITHQGDRCCSREFARELARRLNDIGQVPYQQWVLDSTGVFTDSANYTNLIGECTNLSVGYFDAHTTSEHFDSVWYTQIFLPSLLRVKWSDLPTSRKPGESDFKWANRNTCPKGEKKWPDRSRGNPWDDWGYPRSAPLKKTTWDTVTAYTPDYLLPEYTFSMGIPSELADPVRRAMQKRLYRGDYLKVASEIYDAMSVLKKQADFATETVVICRDKMRDLQSALIDATTTIAELEEKIAALEGRAQCLPMQAS